MYDPKQCPMYNKCAVCIWNTECKIKDNPIVETLKQKYQCFCCEYKVNCPYAANCCIGDNPNMKLEETE